MSLGVLRWVLAAIGLILFFGGLYLFWQNRASEKVAQTFLTVFVLGMGGAVASILLSLREESKSVRFPVVYIVDRKTAFPEALASGGRPYVLLQSRDGTPITKVMSSDDELAAYYLDITAYVFLETLFSLYDGNWHRRLLDLRWPASSETAFDDVSKPSSGYRVDWKQMQSIFPDNEFVKKPRIETAEFMLPPGTVLTGSASAEGAVLHARNPFFEFEMKLSYHGYGEQLGVYSDRIDSKSRDLTVMMYVAILHATFNQYRMGHPEMPRYRDWVDTTFEKLQRDHSWYRQWEEEEKDFGP